MYKTVQLDDNIRIWLLEEERCKSVPETWKCQCRNNVFGQFSQTFSTCSRMDGQPAYRMSLAAHCRWTQNKIHQCHSNTDNDKLIFSRSFQCKQYTVKFFIQLNALY